MKTAVLIHGLHLEAHSWESLVWGNLAGGTWGTVPRGVEYAWRIQADVLVWGSGASECDGKKEAEVTYALALAHIEELAKLCSTDAARLKSFIEARSVRDIEAKDTAGEVRNTFELCLLRDISEIVLVPVGSQVPIASRRALALSLEDKKYSVFRHRVLIVPSDGVYEGTSMQDIVIFAPPHRGDRVANPSHILARKTLNVIQKLSKSKQAEKIQELLSAWDMLLERYDQ